MDTLEKETKQEEVNTVSHASGSGGLIAALAIGGIVFGGVVPFACFMVGNAAHANALHVEVQNASIAYDSWLKDHSNATENEKNDAVKKFTDNLASKGNIGIAFYSTTNKICAWESEALISNDIKHSLTASSINGFRTSNRDIDCSTAVAITSPAGEDNAAGQEFPWSTMLGILATAGVALGGTGGIIFGVKKSSAKRKKRTENQVKLEKLLERHDAVRQAWASYELDPMKMLDYPLLSDMREKTTQDLLLALRKANDIRETHSIQSLQTSEIFTDYKNAVLELEHTFEVAEREAKRVQWSNFSQDEQKRLIKAKQLMGFVLDANGSDFERQAAYKQLAKEINGLIALPNMTIQSLESSMRLVLTNVR